MRLIVATGFYPGAQMGGAEYQTMMLAKGLAARGHTVFFLATASGEQRRFADENVTVVEIPGWRVSGRAGYRRDLAAVLRDLQPDLVYARIFAEIADISAACRAQEVAVVSISCGGMEVTPFLVGHHPREAVGHFLAGETLDHLRSFRAIRHSAAHICNTEEFRGRVARWYPRKEIRTIYNASAEPDPAEIHREPGNRVIWVNNIKRVKRPDWFMELARRLPQYDFVMIGALYAGTYWDEMRRQLENGPANLHYLGKQSLAETNREIGRSDLLVYTSIPGREGFGNSFLQAWFRAVPTISTYPLDGILEREAIGRHAPTMDELVTAVDEMMRQVDSRMAAGERARHYARSQHSITAMVDQYEELFRTVAAGAAQHTSTRRLTDEHSHTARRAPHV